MTTEHGAVGRAIPRTADGHLLRGQGRFVDDLAVAGTLHAVFVRSPIAAGDITEVTTDEARAVPGVVEVLIGADIDLPGIAVDIDRAEYVRTEMPLLAVDRVRHQGEPVAVVIATSRAQAEDAAELVDVVIEPTDTVVDIDAAVRPGAPRVHDDAPDNTLLTITIGDPDLRDELRQEPVHIELGISSARVTAAPMEGRACLAQHDEVTGRLTLTTSTQQPHLVRSAIAHHLGIADSDVRVVTDDVGGAFGQKLGVSREEIIVSYAARRLNAPVRWIEDRFENLTAAVQGHEQRYNATAGFDSDGRLVGIAADIDCNTGAYSAHPWSCALEPGMAAAELPGPYVFDRYHARARAIATHKPSTAPYRGVSRPQITLLTERIMDEAAAQLGLSRAEIRRRNLIPTGSADHVSAAGLSYDEGSHLRALERCLELVEFDTWPERQAVLRNDGRLVGLGLATLSEHTSYGTETFVKRRMAVIPGFDAAEVDLDATGRITVATGTVAQGQGHKTTMAQLVADVFGVDATSVRVVAGDTDVAPYGWGAFASRSAAIAGSAAIRAGRSLAEVLVKVAAHLLEVAEEQVQLRDGVMSADGVEREIDLAELGWTMHNRVDLLPKGVDALALRQRATFEPEAGAFSNATHAVELEVHPTTGAVSLLRYVVVEDCGRVINPAIVDGQIRGGIANGIGIALYEQVRHDADGQCLSATLADYLLPTATECCDVEIHHLETPSPRSESGAKGVGESGTIGAPAAIVSGINDALGHLGIAFNTVPVTPAMITDALDDAHDTHDSRGEPDAV